ncbi:unnamed protein product [Clonostachys solani]|uniref:Uncharacterized protein n=1 Tax=Clonostachys solani TaxID=160281 RepID=A0A9N9ZJK3_9HYPO|nr:unnamed protein product [Clonostachys solani]
MAAGIEAIMIRETRTSSFSPTEIKMRPRNQVRAIWDAYVRYFETDQSVGAELVSAALSELRKVQKSPHHRARRTPGVMTTVLQFAMKAIPTGPAKAPSHGQTTSAPVNGPLANAVELLEQAAKQNNSDALLILAEMNFFGKYNYPRDLHVAFTKYSELSAIHGNATAQYMLGVYYSTGLGGVVPADQAKALLHHTFGAANGDLRSEMAIAFRYLAGIGTVKNCEKSVGHYKNVANKAIDWYRSGPPGGRSWIQQSWRISDDDGGIYGEGASVSSAGLNAFRPNPSSDANAAIGDVIEYLDLMSQKGDFKAAFNLGRTYYEGQRGLDQNLELAKKYFFLVVSRYWKRDGTRIDNFKQGIEKTAGKAAAFIGRMYLRGEGVTQNFEKAKIWFERGISQTDPMAYYGLGLINLNGLGVKKNVKRAMDLLKKSADQDYAPAQVEMGRLYLDQGGVDDLRTANNYFELAARYGNIESGYYIAEMVNNGVGREYICSVALSFYKLVAEKAEPLVSTWDDANTAYEEGDLDRAFLEYLLAAEQGYEKAQTNIAYMLDTERSKLPIQSWAAKAIGQSKPQEGNLLNNPALALIQWTRSSRQNNVDSTVKMGDYYFYGIGTEKDIGKAVQCYTSASDHSQSAQALFNLGWMHENGFGLDQDFHLAKRYYDHALTVNKEAYLPVTLSLLKLRLRSAWNTVTHGPIHSIQDEPKLKKDWSLGEWIANFIKDDRYFDEEIRIEDIVDDPIGTGEGDFQDDGVIESLLIIGVMAALVFLLWWRQRMQQAHAQAEEAARRRAQGLPPQPPQAGGPGNNLNPDDGFAAWAGGGLGL